MNTVAIIPARMGSSRFPGKPMAKIKGIPMIGHVYMRVVMAESLDDTWVATCDQEIFDYIESIGGKAVMTADTHERCSDRCAEAMLKIEEMTGKKIDIVVMAQGDEPLVTPATIDTAAQALQNADSDVGVACLMGEIKDETEFKSPHSIKVIVDVNDRAMFMSREPIPTMCKGGEKGKDGIRWLKQICTIPYTRDYLLKFNGTPPSPLEIAESIDLNRCLENAHPVQMAMCPDIAVSVDTPQDRDYAESVMENDTLYPLYAEKAKVAA